MESNYIEEFHQYLNTVCDSIKFTREEDEGSLAYLDMLGTRTPEGALQSTKFRKPTHTGSGITSIDREQVNRRQLVLIN